MKKRRKHIFTDFFFCSTLKGEIGHGKEVYITSPPKKLAYKHNQMKPNLHKEPQANPTQTRKEVDRKVRKKIKICLGVFLLSFFLLIFTQLSRFWNLSEEKKVKNCHTKTFAKTYAH